VGGGEVNKIEREGKKSESIEAGYHMFRGHGLMLSSAANALFDVG